MRKIFSHHCATFSKYKKKQLPCNNKARRKAFITLFLVQTSQEFQKAIIGNLFHLMLFEFGDWTWFFWPSHPTYIACQSNIAGNCIVKFARAVEVVN